MTAPREVRNREPSIIGVLIALAFLPVAWVAYWIGHLGHKLSKWKEDRAK